MRHTILKYFYLTVFLSLIVTSCDSNSTTINESAAKRQAAVNIIDEAIREDEKAKVKSNPVDNSQLSMETEDITTTDEGIMDLQGISVSTPEDWRLTPRDRLGQMRTAEFEIPTGLPGEESVKLVAFHFGADQGGSTQANIDRWIGQVKREGDEPPPLIETINKDKLTITTLYVEGTIKPPTMGGSGQTNPISNGALWAAVIEGGPQGSIFLKTTGKRESIQAALPELQSVIDSLNVQ
jgi:hypothetical protein